MLFGKYLHKWAIQAPLHFYDMTAIVIGATGAVGIDLVSQLMDDTRFEEVHIFVRRSVSIEHPKLRVHVVDFDKLDEWKAALQGDVLFSALGTTIKQAGSQQAQWKIDYTYQYEVAKAACENGVSTMILVSSAWVTPTAKAFYMRMKGQLEVDVKKLGFGRLVIVRPPSLIRKNTDRFGERMSIGILQTLNKIGILKSFRPMPTEQVSHAMIEMAKGTTNEVLTLEPQDIWKI